MEWCQTKPLIYCPAKFCCMPFPLSFTSAGRPKSGWWEKRLSRLCLINVQFGIVQMGFTVFYMNTYDMNKSWIFFANGGTLEDLRVAIQPGVKCIAFDMSDCIIISLLSSYPFSRQVRRWADRNTAGLTLHFPLHFLCLSLSASVFVCLTMPFKINILNNLINDRIKLAH